MPNVIFYVSYKLKKGASVEDFLLASKKLNDEYMSKQNGYISWKQGVDGETWVDLITFETMEDAKRVEKSTDPNELAKKFYSFINLMSCKVHFYSIERDY
jgi:hypothetical protein